MKKDCRFGSALGFRVCFFFFVSAIALLAFGCGSSGGSDDSVPDVPYCSPVSNWDPEWVEWEARVVKLMNQARAAGAVCGTNTMPSVGPLEVDPALRCAARVHSMDMAERGYFDHFSPEGEGPTERFQKAGWSGRGWGENIAAGGGSADTQFDMWMNSPGHCANIMKEGFSQVGLGYYNISGGYRDYLTAAFGGQ